jgi:protein-disulfide isomerase
MDQRNGRLTGTYCERNGMIRFIQSRKYILTIVLALVAMGIEFYYNICAGSCSYLKGDIFGIGLQYIGIAFMVVVSILSIIKKDLLLVVLLSAGVGVELYLMGFQIWYNKYCLYCLLFGGVLVVQFLINFDWKKEKTVFVMMAAALLLFPIFFHGSITPVYAADDVSPPIFGQGPIKVRLYADYFCPPCRALSPKIGPVLADLVKRNIITLTFIDTPFYKHSSMYARYFLYTMQEKKDIDTALAVRNVLFSASSTNITDTIRLEEALKNKGILFKAFEVKPIFDLYNTQLQSDKVEATPSCVIEQGGKKELFVGDSDIPRALEKLLK